MAKDYKDTVFLPQTDFPMRGNLAQKEPEILKQWQEQDLYGQLRVQSKGREKFILHDGPPFANGNLHVGHALGSVIKDVVNRTQQMSGKDAPYVLGWDCHGLPIEWKVEERHRAAGLNKEDVPVLEFRAECREFAAGWVRTQAEQFQRIGLLSDTENPYLTMSRHAEARIAGEVHKFLMNGGLYQGSRPVMWSTVEKTALADAEVEYHDHKSTTIWVKFPIVSGPVVMASVVIWTTTPWTIPGNRAVAFGDDIEYALYTVDEADDDSIAFEGERLLLARALAPQVFEKAKVSSWSELEVYKGSALASMKLAHPLRGQGYDFEVPMLSGEFVTEEAGTGFVHISPGHGEDDFRLGKANGIEVPRTVDDEGRYFESIPLFAGKQVYTSEGKTGDANGAVIKALIDAGKLLAKGNITHSYPHSWRSKAPVIFRTTPQWFISMDTNGLRDKALQAIDHTWFYPEQGRNRIRSMVEGRPDWCISRQRSWGVPIAIFVDRETGEPLKDQAVLDRIVQLFEAEGSDCWYSRPAEDFLGTGYDASRYAKVMDIVDVWFESGSTHVFTLEDRADLSWPADLYAEGSDQHRGWFQSSLLEACGTRGRAPYKAVLTHGFLLDEKQNKMSKSLGNIVSTETVCEREGADILRLWAVSGDYTQDVVFGPEILKQTGETYRRLRNTLRYLLGALDGFSEAERVPYDQMPSLEKYVLAQLEYIDGLRVHAFQNYDFKLMMIWIHQFASQDLSAFYFDIRKDSLYCDAPDSLRRRAARTVMKHLLECLILWLAPVLCFTAEEAWAASGGQGSVHLQPFPALPEAWRNEELRKDWEKLRAIRAVVTGAIELARADKTVGASLQARPELFVADQADYDWLSAIDFPLDTLAIVSAITLTPGTGGDFQLPELPGYSVTVRLAEGDKCDRCWRVLPEVGQGPDAEPVCARCASVVEGQERRAA